MSYLAKYLKYKNKYLLLKSGGSLSFINEIVKPIEINNQTHYKSFGTQSTKFTDEQRQTIHNLIDYILPNLVMNGTNFTKDEIDGIEVMGAGTFGVTIYINDLLIKIVRMGDFTNEDLISNELETLHNIFISTHVIVKGKENLSEYYGYLTSNDIVGKKMDTIDNHIMSSPKLYNTHGIHSTFSETSQKISINLDNIKEKLHFSTDMVFLFMDKSSKDVITFLSDVKKHIFNQQEDYDKLKGSPQEQSAALRLDKLRDNYIYMIKQFVWQIFDGINYLHKLNYIHNDIKLENTVVKRRISIKREMLFQIIDFGLATKLQPGTDILQQGNFGTLPYYKNSIFETRRSFLYDWHCMYIELLEFFYIVDFGKHTNGDFVYTGPGSDVFQDKNINNSYGITQFDKYNLELRKYLYKNISEIIIDKETRVIFLNILLLLSYAQYIARETSLQNLNFIAPMFEISVEQGGKIKRVNRIIKNTVEYETYLGNEITKLR